MKKIFFILFVLISFQLNAQLVNRQPKGGSLLNDIRQSQYPAVAQLYIYQDSVMVFTETDTYYTVIDFQTYYNLYTLTTDSTITIVFPGWYLVGQGMSYTHNLANTVVHHCIFINDIEFNPAEAQRKIATGGDVGFSGYPYIIYLDAGDVVKIKIRVDSAGNLTINHMGFYVIKIY